MHRAPREPARAPAATRWSVSIHPQGSRKRRFDDLISSLNCPPDSADIGLRPIKYATAYVLFIGNARKMLAQFAVKFFCPQVRRPKFTACRACFFSNSQYLNSQFQ